VVGQDTDGSTAYGYDKFELDPHLQIDSPNPTPPLHTKDFDREIERIRHQTLETYRARDYRAAAAEFERVWKEIHPTFDILRDFPAPVFCAGLVHFAARPKPPRDCDRNWLFARVHDHTLGNFGEHGRFDPTPASEEESWALGLLPLTRQNSLAITRGTGRVESVFLLSEDRQIEWNKERTFQKDFAALKIVTLLRPSGNRTAAFVAEYKPNS
jgi:hypothetical protein